ncbi:50S ribosomal protein L20 [Candidatus Vidania fulgoroideorum]
MTRVKKGKKTRKRKFFLVTKGFRNRRKNVFRLSKQAYIKSLYKKYTDFKKRKSIFKKKWIKIVNNFISFWGIKYNKFIRLLKLKNIIINKYILYILTLNFPFLFQKIVSYIIGC